MTKINSKIIRLDGEIVESADVVENLINAFEDSDAMSQDIDDLHSEAILTILTHIKSSDVDDSYDLEFRELKITDIDFPSLNLFYDKAAYVILKTVKTVFKDVVTILDAQHELFSQTFYVPEQMFFTALNTKMNVDMAYEQDSVSESFLNKVYLTGTELRYCDEFALESKEDREVIHNVMHKNDVALYKSNKKVFEALSKMFNVVKTENKNIFKLYHKPQGSSEYENLGVRVRCSNRLLASVDTFKMKSESSILELNRESNESLNNYYKTKINQLLKEEKKATINIPKNCQSLILEFLPVLCTPETVNQCELTTTGVDTPKMEIKCNEELPQELQNKVKDAIDKAKSIYNSNESAKKIVTMYYQIKELLKGLTEDQVRKMSPFEQDEMIWNLLAIKNSSQNNEEGMVG